VIVGKSVYEKARMTVRSAAAVGQKQARAPRRSDQHHRLRTPAARAFAAYKGGRIQSDRHPSKSTAERPHRNSCSPNSGQPPRALTASDSAG